MVGFRVKPGMTLKRAYDGGIAQEIPSETGLTAHEKMSKPQGFRPMAREKGGTNCRNYHIIGVEIVRAKSYIVIRKKLLINIFINFRRNHGFRQS
jgi:hypothetical protein